MTLLFLISGGYMLNFEEWLESEYGVDWAYWDNNYSSDVQDKMFGEYESYRLEMCGVTMEDLNNVKK